MLDCQGATLERASARLMGGDVALALAIKPLDESLDESHSLVSLLSGLLQAICMDLPWY